MQPLPQKAALAALFLAVAPGAPVQRHALGFHPREASVLEKSFKTDCLVTVDELTVSMNGAETDPSLFGIPADLEVSFGYVLECADVYERVADGRPLALLRTFEVLESWYVDPEGVEERDDTGDFVMVSLSELGLDIEAAAELSLDITRAASAQPR